MADDPVTTEDNFQRSNRENIERFEAENCQTKTAGFAWSLPGPNAGPEYSQGFSVAKRQADAEIERLRNGLRIISGEIPSPDSLLGNADIARIILHGK